MLCKFAPTGRYFSLVTGAFTDRVTGVALKLGVSPLATQVNTIKMSFDTSLASQRMVVQWQLGGNGNP
jgi:hypothetical protein